MVIGDRHFAQIIRKPNFAEQLHASSVRNVHLRVARCLWIAFDEHGSHAILA
jgi:hypothetical protein